MYRRRWDREKIDLEKLPKHELSAIGERVFSGELSLSDAVDEFVFQAISHAMKKTDSNQTEVALMFGVGRTTIAEYLARFRGRRPAQKRKPARIS